MTRESEVRWTHVGLLAACALLLAYAETFIPIPIPGVKLGLANIPVLVLLARHDATGAVYVALIKVLATGLLFGSPLTLAYSLAGTLLSLVGMVPLSRLATMRLWMTSIVGALLHEAGQLAVASVVLGTSVIWYAAPVLYVAGCVTGAICGMLALQVAGAIPTDEELAGVLRTTREPVPRSPRLRVCVAFVLLLAYCVLTLHLNDLAWLGASVAGALLSCVATRTKVRSYARVLRLVLLVSAFTLVLQLLTQAHDPGVETIRATLRLSGLALASVAFMQLVPTDDLADTVAWIVRPFARVGVHTEGFVLAFAVALDLLPTLADIVRDRPRNLALRDLVPTLVRRFYEG